MNKQSKGLKVEALLDRRFFDLQTFDFQTFDFQTFDFTSAAPAAR